MSTDTVAANPLAGMRTGRDSLGVLQMSFALGNKPGSVEDFSDGDFDLANSGLFLGLFGVRVVGIVVSVGGGFGVGIGGGRVAALVDGIDIGCGSDAWACAVCAGDIVSAFVTRSSEL